MSFVFNSLASIFLELLKDVFSFTHIEISMVLLDISSNASSRESNFSSGSLKALLLFLYHLFRGCILF